MCTLVHLQHRDLTKAASEILIVIYSTGIVKNSDLRYSTWYHGYKHDIIRDVYERNVRRSGCHCTTTLLVLLCGAKGEALPTIFELARKALGSTVP